MAEQLNASCVSINGRGVLLFGPSGSGKSDLALRLIDAGATLVGDDQVMVECRDGNLYVSPCERIEGKIEARGVGILELPYVKAVPAALAIKLSHHEDIERMPNPAFFDCLGVQVPLLSLHAFDASTPAKIRLYLSLQE